MRLVLPCERQQHQMQRKLVETWISSISADGTSKLRHSKSCIKNRRRPHSIPNYTSRYWHGKPKTFLTIPHSFKTPSYVGSKTPICSQIPPIHSNKRGYLGSPDMISNHSIRSILNFNLLCINHITHSKCAILIALVYEPNCGLQKKVGEALALDFR